MNNTKFYDDALDIVKQAVEADQKSETLHRNDFAYKCCGACGEDDFLTECYLRAADGTVVVGIRVVHASAREKAHR